MNKVGSLNQRLDTACTVEVNALSPGAGAGQYLTIDKSKELLLPALPWLVGVAICDCVCETLLSCLNVADGVSLLCSHPSLYNSPVPWSVLRNWTGVEAYIPFMPPAILYRTIHTDRNAVMYSIVKLGYNCIKCYRSLNGPNGFFACSNVCNRCAVQHFVRHNCPYVDGIIKFYLCGDDFVTTRGQAFVEAPYWISLDDAYKTVVRQHDNAFMLAQKIFEEKEFFKSHAPLCIHRPRDDKRRSLQRMIRMHRESISDDNNSGAQGMQGLNPFELDSHVPKNNCATRDILPGVDSFISHSYNSSCEQSMQLPANDADGAAAEPKWVEFLPSSLKSLYVEECTKRPTDILGWSVLASTSTQPLKTLVVEMHSRPGVIHHYL